ncbi:hypothetical protein CHUAL_013074 [Chamberlinius hualienensis]
MDDVRNDSFFVDEDEEEVFVGPVTFRENIVCGLRSKRKTDLFAVKLRESLLFYREQEEKADETDNLDLSSEKHENLIENAGKKEEDDNCDIVQQISHINVVDGMEESLNKLLTDEEEDTYFTCCQSLHNGDDLSELAFDATGNTRTRHTTDELVAPPSSTASSDLDDSLNDDVESDHEAVPATEMLNLENVISECHEMTDVESKSIETNVVETEEELLINQKENVENQYMTPVKVTQSCQTSFINNEGQYKVTPCVPLVNDGMKAQNSSPFKTPLAVTKRFNTNSASNSTKNRFLKSPLKPPSSASPLKKPFLTSPLSYGAKRFDHIKSPIAKYINEAPPPPLVVNIRSNGAKASKISKSKQPKEERNLRSKSKAEGNATNEHKNTSSSALSAVSDESILERFGLTVEEFERLEDKSLKTAFKKFMKEEKRNSLQMNLNGVDEHVKMIPVANYKGPTALAAVPMRKELDLLTKLATYRNYKLPVPTPKPIIMKHIGERKKLHWDRNFMSSNKKDAKKPGIISSSVFINLPERLDDTCNEESMVEVSMVEVVASPRTNTLFKK